MDITFEPSFQDHLRSKITTIEFIELSLLGFSVWCLGAYNAARSGESLFDILNMLILLELVLLGSWGIYNLYIRVARSLGGCLGHMLWMVAVLGTGSYFLWAWILLDANRFVMSRLFYRGEAPIEYAFSPRSRQRRYDWEEARKANMP